MSSTPASLMSARHAQSVRVAEIQLRLARRNGAGESR